MSTRSTYRVIEKGVYENKPWKNVLVLLYLHCDGYPDGHPLETAEWLAKGTLVTGLGFENPEIVFNGTGCLAAQLVAKYKDGPGGAYIHPVNHRGKSGEDYTYDIIVDSNTKTIEFIAYDVNGGWAEKPARFKKLFSGTPDGYSKWVKNRK